MVRSSVHFPTEISSRSSLFSSGTTAVRSVLYLASSSPQRSRILKALGLEFEIIHPQIDETAIEGETVRNYVSRLAINKARKGASLITNDPGAAVVLGADTCVVIDDLILGKPQDREEALDMLQRLSGRVHEVLSAVAVNCGGDVLSMVDSSKVEFDKLTKQQLELYLQSREYENRAGAYAIQGSAAKFVRRLDGSRSGVIGLPIMVTAQLLEDAGFAVPFSDVADRNLEEEFPTTHFWDGKYSI